MYWFAAQQQSISFRRRKIDPFYLKFTAELNEFVPRLQTQQEEAQKLLKHDAVEKRTPHVLRRLKVRGDVKNIQ